MYYRSGALLIILCTSFFIVIDSPAAVEGAWEVRKVNFDGNVFKIVYDITNARLKAIQIDPDFASMILSIVSDLNEDGTLELVIPRNLMDPRGLDGRDEDFIVLADGEETEIEEINKTPCFRTILIYFSAGSKKIEVIGATLIGQGAIGAPPKPEAPPVYVATDKNNYQQGEVITLSGCTNLALDDKWVSLEILNRERKMYRIISLAPNIDGYFSTSVPVKESTINGTYTITASYAGQSTTSIFVVPEFPIVMIILATSFALIIVRSLARGSKFE